MQKIDNQGMLEQYTTSLEQEVEERTKELVEEKKKSDILLYRMLPRQVVEKLKLGIMYLHLLSVLKLFKILNHSISIIFPSIQYLNISNRRSFLL